MYGQIGDQLQGELEGDPERGHLQGRADHRLPPRARRSGVGDAAADVLNFCANNYLGLADDRR